MAPAAEITVTRVGTQVVVRLEGHVTDAGQCDQALDAVIRLALNRVTVDLAYAQSLDACAIDFLTSLQGRWVVRHLNTPPHLRALLPRRFVVPDPETLEA